MNRILVAGLLVALLVVVAPVMAATLYVDQAGSCDSNLPCYFHPQDAVNAANVGDIIKVYPGTYGTRNYPCPWSPSCSCSDDNAPALIVYKNGLTIETVSDNPEDTIIQSTHNCWSNVPPVKQSTNNNVNPVMTAPNGISIIANDVTIDGFTVISTYQGDNPSGYPNTAGVFIGALYAGDPNSYGISGTVIQNCKIKGHSGIRLWKAPDTVISGCRIFNGDATIGIVQPALQVWDGWNEGPSVGSSGLHVINSEITSYLSGDGISLGGYYVGLVDHSNLYIDGNIIDSSGNGVTFYGSGGTSKVMTCNNIVNVPNGNSQVGVWWGTYDGPFGLDSDGDGILDCDELEFCWGTGADIPSVKLGVNRWIWDGTDWVTVLPKGVGPKVDFTIEQTGGCGCSQILDWLQVNYPTEYPNVDGHRKFGCSISIVQDFIGLVSAV